MTPISLTSPVLRIPFGKYKGELLFTAPTSFFRWLMNQELTDETLDTLSDALQLKENEGSYAVLRISQKNKRVVKLKSIHSLHVFAEANCKDSEEYIEIIYPIITPQKNKHGN